MNADTIQARYDELDRVASRFGKASAASADLHRRITRCVEALERGGWQGRGADAFFAEMHSTLYPAMQRLVKALDQGRAVTLEIKEILRAAEEEAAGRFGRDQQFSGLGAASDGGAYGDGNPNGAEASGSRHQGHSLPNIDLTYEVHEGKYGFKYGIPEGNFGSKSIGGSTQLGPIKTSGMIEGTLGEYDAGAGVEYTKKHGFSAGVFGEIYSATAKAEAVIGDEQFGLTRDIEVKGPGAEGFIGIRENSIGASIGVSAATLKGETGVNIAGANVGVSGEVGWKAELGLQIGKVTKVKLPFVSLGISFGGAKDGKPD